MSGLQQDREIICRCEEVTIEEIKSAIENGDVTLDAIKKRTRAGMGFCQGRTCKRLIARLISSHTGFGMDTYLPGSIRMPVGPISLKLIAETECGDEE